eukprot:COSAG04_NODE_2385_length_4229_cov_1.507748_9_plen_25_part_01
MGSYVEELGISFALNHFDEVHRIVQ